jgi:hypothetical protein
VRRPQRHHAAVFLQHQYLCRRPGGWRGPVLPLTPSGRRGVVVRDLHHGRMIDRSGDQLWGTIDAAVAATVAAARVATSCRDPAASAAPRGGSLARCALCCPRRRR